MSSFCGFTNALESITKLRFIKVDDINNAMGLTAVDLANSAALQ